MSVRKGSSSPQKPVEAHRPFVEDEEMPGAGIMETKGRRLTGKSILYFHPGLECWSVKFFLQGSTLFTWITLPNERIARGAYAGGPPYDDQAQEGGQAPPSL